MAAPSRPPVFTCALKGAALLGNYLPNNFNTMKITTAPDRLPPSSKYSNDQPAAATMGVNNARVNMPFSFSFRLKRGSSKR